MGTPRCPTDPRGCGVQSIDSCEGDKSLQALSLGNRPNLVAGLEAAQPRSCIVPLIVIVPVPREPYPCGSTSRPPVGETGPCRRAEVLEADFRRVPIHDLSSHSAAVLPRSSTAKEPCSSLPARSYRWMTTPVLDGFASTSRKAPGMVPSPNSRLPEPMGTGKTHRLNSSTRSCFNNVWIRLELPVT